MNLSIFDTANLFDAATNLFGQLGIKLNSNTAEPLPAKELLKQHWKENDAFRSVAQTYFIGLIDDSVFKPAGMFDIKYAYQDALPQTAKSYEGLMLFALELEKHPSRTETAELARAFNRTSLKMPVGLLLKYQTEAGTAISLAISERFKYRQEWRQGEKAGKIIILRDIKAQNPHAGHLRILKDLAKPAGAASYKALHEKWLQVLDVDVLNKRFFKDLADWYFWATENVTFPDDLEKNGENRNAVSLIRLITRVVFVWFIKEKNLVPEALFHKNHIGKILKGFNKDKESRNYYQAILQNLFFGTLNQKAGERRFAKEGGLKTNQEEYGVKNLFRHADLFDIPEKEALALFENVPFLNGGLFDCLDKPDENGKIVYVDGFSRNQKKQARIPDFLFFGEETEIDLNSIYDTKNKKYKTKGLLGILESYKFTIAENTPIEEEIALDPELLGKVFENLLASYNPETKTTARKQTGSFYTPREIVDYMVDESLLGYLGNCLNQDLQDFRMDRILLNPENPQIQQILIQTEKNHGSDHLRALLSYSDAPNPFNQAQTQALIQALNDCKILDPACGSGAYPMGILHKMVHILQKLDPDNKMWRELQRQKALLETETAYNIGDKGERNKRLSEISDVFENNASDYGRKLYLIENCIYGIDIQPIAVQIAKLRFFISLVIDQNKQPEKENFGIRSLPNLETKFVAANSLIGLNKPAQTLLRNPKIEEKENALKELRHKYFTASSRKEKLQYQNDDKKLRQEIAKMLEKDGWDTATAKQIVAFDPYDQNKFADWFEAGWMFGHTAGFDVLIGNPPYVQLQKMKGSEAFAKEKFDTYSKSSDLYCLFYEKGIGLLRPGGLLAYITSNSWMRTQYGAALRKFFREKTNPLRLLNFEDGQIFESAIVESNILIAQKAPFAKALIATAVKPGFDKNGFHAYEQENAVILTELDDEGWIIADKESYRIKKQIETGSVRLGEMNVAMNIGVNTGLNEVFIVDENTKQFLIGRDEKNVEIFKPVLRGRDLRRFQYTFSNLWLINSHNGLRDKSYKGKDEDKMWIVKPVYVKKDYPTVFEYFEQHEDKMKKRFDQGWHWTNLRSCAYLLDFEKPKIIWGELADKAKFTYDESGIVVNNTMIFMTGENLKFILSILNSKLAEWYFSQISTTSGMGTNRWLKYKIEQMPIKQLSSAGMRPFEVLVEYVLWLKTTKIAEEKDRLIPVYFEQLLDGMVYELYFEEEIKAGGAEVLKYLPALPALTEGEGGNNQKTIDKVCRELSAPGHPITKALLKLQEIEEVKVIEGRM